RPRQGSLRPFQPSPDRGDLQGVRAGAPRGVLEGSPAGPDTSFHEGPPVIALIDYGAGNLTSVRKALTAVDAPFETPSSPKDLDRATGIIVPGVGNFGATRAIDAAWRAAILAAVERRVPLLGICLGLQYLFEG